MRIKFEKDPLAVEQNNYFTKIVNLNSVSEYDLPKVPLTNFTLKTCLFRATNIVKNIDKDKWVVGSYRIVFDPGDWWSFGNGTATNVIIVHHHIEGKPNSISQEMKTST